MIGMLGFFLSMMVILINQIIHFNGGLNKEINETLNYSSNNI